MLQGICVISNWAHPWNFLFTWMSSFMLFYCAYEIWNVQTMLCSCRNGKNLKSMNDMKSVWETNYWEKGGLSLSVVKSLVRRDKEERSSSEFFWWWRISIFDVLFVQIRYALTWCAEDVCLHCHFKLWCIIVFSEEQFQHDGNNGNPELLHSRSLSKDQQGAPPRSFIHHLVEVIGSISYVHKMAFFWQSVVLEVSIMQINCPS